MSNWNDLGNNEASVDTVRLDSKIQTLCEIHNRKLSDEARAHWLRQLKPYAKGKAIYAALESGCNERVMPSVAWVLEQMAILARGDVKPYVEPPRLTPSEQKRSDNAAILSLLWLHYTRGWSLEDIGGRTIARLFAEQIGKPVDDVPKLLEAAKEIYPRDMVLRWMEDQRAIGN